MLEARLKEVEQVARALPPLKDSTPTAQSTDPKPANPTPVPAVTKPAASSGTPFYQWTAEQDLMLMKLKAENMSWRAISTGLGKPVYVLKDRWAIIQPKIRAPKEASKVQKENEPASNPEGNNKHQHRVSFSEPLVTPVNTVSLTFIPNFHYFVLTLWTVVLLPLLHY